MTDPATPGRERLRVLFFDHTAALSGGELALLQMVQHLDRTAFDPMVLLAARGPLVDKLRESSTVHVVPLGATVRHARKDALRVGSLFQLRAVWAAVVYTWQLMRFLLRHDIQLVHTNSLKADLLGGVAARLVGIPVIWHVRDRIAEDYLPRNVVRLFRWLSCWLPTAIIANSRATAESLKTNKGRQKPTYVVHDGVCLERFSTSRPARSGAGGMVGIVGRISPWKGQDIFLRAAQQVKMRYPLTRFRIVGSALFGEERYEIELHALASELELENVVEFTGFSDDVPAEVARLDVFVHASTKPEPFGQVIIEAMAAAVPVVATEGGGVPEIIQHGVNGLLVPLQDHSSMADAICSLLGDPAVARRLALRGLQDVEDHFAIQRTAAETERVFLEVTTNIRPATIGSRVDVSTAPL